MRVRMSDSVSVHVERRLKLLLGGFPCSTHPIAGADSGDRTGLKPPVSSRDLAMWLVRFRNIHPVWTPACKAAGVAARPHDPRATWLYDAGWSPVEIAARWGMPR
jgi:hypothetical protein